MTSETFAQLQAAFEHYEALPPAEQAPFLQALQTQSPKVYTALIEMLEVGRTEGALGDLKAEWEKATQEVTALPQIGGYKLLRQIGQGGMGMVYLAERVSEFHQMVALKVLPLLGLKPEQKQLFNLERQVLAQLEHPHIARIYDGGESASGLSYIVMEYIEGQPLTEYADQHQLSFKARIELLQQVCEAVQYAHQNLIVHRDLKPSNILVDQNGHVKLIDFGIARPVQAVGAETHTQFRLMTLEYASPEQILGTGLSTISDVYSLGVVCYELLTGFLPYKLKRGTQGELEESILTLDPLRPSLVLGTETDKERIAQIIENRKITKEGFIKNLRGDLEAILLKALAKKPQDRYATALAFAQDLDRYLKQEPILAKPARLRYKTQKFIQRNWKPLAVAAVFMMTVLAGAGTAIYQADQAKKEARKSQASVDYLLGLFKAATPYDGGTGFDTLRVKTLFNIGSHHKAFDVTYDLEVEVTMLGILCRLNTDISNLKGALHLGKLAVEKAKKLEGAYSAQIAAYKYYGHALRDANQYKEAISILKEGLAIADAHLDKANWEHIAISLSLASVYIILNENDPEVQSRLQDGLSRLSRLSIADENVWATLNSAYLFQAYDYTNKNKYDLSKAAGLKSASLIETRYGASHPVLGITYSYLCSNASRLGELKDGMLFCKQAYEARKSTGVAALIFTAIRPLISTLTQYGAYDEAMEYAGEAARLDQSMVNKGERAIFQQTHATLLLEMGRYQEAIEAVAPSLSFLKESYGPSHANLTNAERIIAIGYLRLGQLEASEAIVKKECGIKKNASCLSVLGQIALARKDYNSAASIQKELIGLSPQKPTSASYQYNQAILGTILVEQGDLKGGQTLIEQALAVMRSNWSPDHTRIGRILFFYGRGLVHQGQKKAALPLLQEAYQIYEKVMGKDHPDTKEVRLALHQAR